MAISAYEAMTGRSLPTGVTSVVQNQPGVYVTGTGNGGTQAYVPKTNTVRTAVYGPDGKITGYRVIITDEFGKLISDKIEPVDGQLPEDLDALAAAKDKILADTLASYGLANVASTVAKIRLAYPKASSEDVLFILKNDPAYNSEYLTRFAGNAALKKAGKPTLSDAQYLQAETEYGKIFTAYGATSLANQSYYATLIGNSMDAVDVTNRMNQAYSVLKNSPQIKKAFNTFYKSVTDGDILAVILDKDTQLPVLQQKITAAEIGGAALSQGLETSLLRAEELRGYGVTGATAQTGYQTIAKKAKRGQFLSEISPETGVKYGQATAEDIQFKKNAEAQRQEDILVGTEIGRFGGSVGRLASKSRAQGLV
jgi:hypothetical protein